VIRLYEDADFAAIKRLHEKAGLPPACLPDCKNPNFIVKIVAENGHGIAQAAFVKLTGEGFILVDHESGTPQERLATLESLVTRGLNDAATWGLDDTSAWLPPEIEKSFGDKLKALGWIKSPWPSWTALLR
jgi:hypothetical protein